MIVAETAFFYTMLEELQMYYEMGNSQLICYLL